MSSKDHTTERSQERVRQARWGTAHHSVTLANIEARLIQQRLEIWIFTWKNVLIIKMLSINKHRHFSWDLGANFFLKYSSMLC